jgi:uncharacterized protein
MNLFEGCTRKKLANGLSWLNEPPTWNFDATGKLTIVPEAVSDFFRPYQDKPNDNSCLLYKEVTGDFTLVTRTKAHLVGFGDAAAMTVRASPTVWAKLCLERSPIGDISLVSVVTREWSDDSNGEVLAKPECYLRLSRKGNVFGMHYSLEGKRWRIVRCFPPAAVKIGVHAQAPFVGGCKAGFDFLDLIPEAVKDFRSEE